MASDPILSIRHLNLQRSHVTVLTDVNLTVYQGEVLTIIGPSGSGKSSLLRTINRLDDAHAGTIQLRGQDIQSLPVVELRRKIGMIFQKTAIFKGTVGDNIQTGPQLRGEQLSPADVLHLMDLASLPYDFLNRPAAELSGGQEQRLGIARALANQPEILLLDEPTSSLDPIATNHVEQALLRLKNDLGLTMIWVSHMVEQARRVSDRVLLLDAGRVIRVDSCAAMLDPVQGDPRALHFAAGEAF